MKKIAGLLLLSLLAPGAAHSQVADCRVLLHNEGVESAYPRLSHDRKTILYQSNAGGKWQLMLKPLDSDQVVNLSNDAYNNNFPDWSYDNSRIAFVSDRDGNEEIYMMDREGKNLQRITQDPARDIHPYFSPDGKYILFNSDRGNGSLDIYRYEIKTGETLRVTNTPDDETCARYSPDMKSMVYLKNGYTGDDVFLMNMSNLTSENLTRTPRTQDGWPMFSPDGKWIYFSSLETGLYHIYRMKPDGTGKQQITEAGIGEEDARVYVSSNNKYFLYNKRSGKTIDIRGCKLAD